MPHDRFSAYGSVTYRLDMSLSSYSIVRLSPIHRHAVMRDDEWNSQLRVRATPHHDSVALPDGLNPPEI